MKAARPSALKCEDAGAITASTCRHRERRAGSKLLSWGIDGSGPTAAETGNDLAIDSTRLTQPDVTKKDKGPMRTPASPAKGRPGVAGDPSANLNFSVTGGGDWRLRARCHRTGRRASPGGDRSLALNAESALLWLSLPLPRNAGCPAPSDFRQAGRVFAPYLHLGR